MSKAAGGPGLSKEEEKDDDNLGLVSCLFYNIAFGLFNYSINTKNVDIDGGGGASTGVDRLDDVGGGVSSGGFANGQLGVSRLGVNGNAVISP